MSKLAQNIRKYRSKDTGIGFLLKGYRVQACLMHRGKERCTIGDYLRSLDNLGMARWFYDNYDCHRYISPENSCELFDSEVECIKCWLKYLNTRMIKG